MIERVAFISIHTSPLDQPGIGDAGGMNVYVDELASAMAARGVGVDVFTRGDDAGLVEVAPRYRVIRVPTEHGFERGELAEMVGEFSEGVITFVGTDGSSYDVVHSHYWLSGWVGVLLQEVLGIPQAISFHTLGRVKDATRRDDDSPSSLLRIAAESEVIARAGCVVASTPTEAAELIEHYAADPERLCVSPPGVDPEVFAPGPQDVARRKLGLGPGPLVLYVGRIQPLKGLDVALNAFAMLAAGRPDARLLVLGGPSGPDGDSELDRVRAQAERLGIAAEVDFRGPVPHHDVADAYRAADALVVPSRSESFGLVAAEAQSCGLPVVAARVGGLAHAVADGESGYLVSSWDPADFAAAVARILDDPAIAAELSAGAVEQARRFSWSQTTERLLELYQGIVDS